MIKRTFHHVVGITQYLGTCKFHIYLDCPQLQKKRVARMVWGDRVSTGAVHSAEYEVPKLECVCAFCRKREEREAVQTAGRFDQKGKEVTMK